MSKRELTVLSDGELIAIMERAIDGYRGDAAVLQSAIGCMMFCREVGWKVVLVMHDRQTIRKYEAILGISFRDHFPEVGNRPDRSLAWRIAQSAKNFWKVVRGEVPGIRKTAEIDAGSTG